MTAAAAALGEIVGAFCLKAGMSRREVAAVYRQLSRAVLQRPLSLEPNTPHVWRQVCDAVTCWWRDAAYLDDAGHPRALPEFGPAPSIESLLTGTVDDDQHDAAKAELLRTVATVRRGVWRFEENSGYLRLLGAPGIDRLIMMLSGMCATFLDNQTRLRDPLVTKNFDRSAHVVEFPMEKAPELRAKLSKRLQRELEDVDGWMTSTAKSHRRGPVALVGVSMFMHTGTPRPRASAKRVKCATARRRKRDGK